jgi:hypothetical protein
MGTGGLTQFHFVVEVSVIGDVWHLDGWYWFGGG